jgi:hypothetical protein
MLRGLWTAAARSASAKGPVRGGDTVLGTHRPHRSLRLARLAPIIPPRTSPTDRSGADPSWVACSTSTNPQPKPQFSAGDRILEPDTLLDLRKNGEFRGRGALERVATDALLPAWREVPRARLRPLWNPSTRNTMPRFLGNQYTSRTVRSMRRGLSTSLVSSTRQSILSFTIRSSTMAS